MDYQEFRTRIGNLTIPNQDLKERLVEGQNSVHFVVSLAAVEDDNYKINISEENMGLFLELLDLLEKRGAKRDIDYFVGGEKSNCSLILGIHTTSAFFSDEDADPSIKRYYTK